MNDTFSTVQAIYVAARGTTANCSMCGIKTFPNGQRTLYCPNCRRVFDRDENAARNILAKGGMRFIPNGPPNEAMVEECAKVAPILKVDGGNLTSAGVE